MTVAYPLQWPDGWERTPESRRSGYSRFKTTFDIARRKLHHELRLLGAKNVVISSNLELRRDGQPRADMARRRMPDPGVAVYFTYRGNKPMVMARDAFDSIHDNMASIAHAVAHLRGLERHGGGTMMDRAFAGFAALPEPGNTAHRRKWWQVLGFESEPTRGDNAFDHAVAWYRQKARDCHPDAGGSHEAMAELNAAIAKAREVLAP